MGRLLRHPGSATVRYLPWAWLFSCFTAKVVCGGIPWQTLFMHFCIYAYKKCIVGSSCPSFRLFFVLFNCQAEENQIWKCDFLRDLAVLPSSQHPFPDGLYVDSWFDFCLLFSIFPYKVVFFYKDDRRNA